MWCVLNAPLLTSCDLRNVSKEDFAIMTDTDLIAVNQDVLGQQAKFVGNRNGVWEYSKTLSSGKKVLIYLNTTAKDKTIKAGESKTEIKLKSHETKVVIL